MLFEYIGSPEVLLGAVSLAALVIYALTGGADFGGGVWDLLARGDRAREQRDAIADTIGPIWEANHVWLILVIVVLFVGYPKVYATIGIALHIPLTLMLFGVVARGSAFVFRKYDVQRDEVHRRWSLVFGVASLLTPVTFGMCVGAIASGQIAVRAGVVQTDFVSEWLAPFPVVVGLYTTALFAYLAAVYLCADVENVSLQEDFRLRALISGVLCGVLAFTALGLSRSGAPLVWEGLLSRWWSWPLQAAVALSAVASLAALWTRRYGVARAAVMVLVTAVILGWGAAQFPYMVVPDLTLFSAKAPDNVLWTTLIILVSGSVILVPSFVYLYSIFQGSGSLEESKSRHAET